MNDSSSNKYREVIAQTLLATMFLSRLPLNSIANRFSSENEEADFSKTTRYFGLAAIIVALPAAFILWAAMMIGLPAPVSATLALIVQVLTTGALHEDALADVADGFGGGKTVEGKLAIMRDSQIGTFGASALILSFVLQLFLLVHLIDLFPAAPLIVVMANIASTIVVIGPWAAFKPARSGKGLSKSLGVPTMQSLGFATMIGAPIAIVIGWIAVGFYPTVFAIFICVVFSGIFATLCDKQVGGHTGDTLGATKKISELGLLLALVMVT